MRQLRKGILVVPTSDPPGCLVYDEVSGEQYQLGTVEQFLISQFEQPFRVEDVCDACNRKFNTTYQTQDIHQFLNLLDEWGLLAEEDVPMADPSLMAPITRAAAMEDSQQARVDRIEYSPPNRWHWFNPEPMLDRINRWVSPFRGLVWLFPFFFFFSLLNVLHNRTELMMDFQESTSTYGIAGRLLLATFTTNLLTQIARGLVGRFYGLAVPSFGIILMLGILPRFNIRLDPDIHLPKTQRLWSSITPSLVRVFIITIGVMAWSLNRATNPTLALAGLEMAFIAFAGLVIVLIPFWPGDSAKVLSTLLDMRDVRGRAMNVLWQYMVRPPAVIRRHTKYRIPLAVFGLFSVLFFVLFVGFIVLKMFDRLEGTYRGTGVAVFLILGAYISFSLRRITKSRETMRAASLSQRGPQLNQIGGTPPPAGKEEKPMHTDPPKRKWPTRLVKCTVWFLLLAALFIPYRNEIGGDVELFPNARATLAVDVAGVIDRVYFTGGEVVEENAVLAQMANHRQRRDLQVAEASIEAKRHELMMLKTTPSAEQVQWAKEEIESARIKKHFAELQLQRLTPLFESGRLSEQEFESSRETLETRRQQLALAKANLAMIEAQINPNQIEVLEAELRRLRHEADYYREQLKQTSVVSPIQGRMVTKDLDFLANSYIQAGQTLAKIEDIDTMWVHIAVPESSIGQVEVGAAVRIRLWAHPGREFEAVVESIHPAADSDSKGRTVTVKARMENTDGLLLSGLTGRAKISGEVTPVIVAFTRAWVRFFRVELWSWLP